MSSFFKKTSRNAVELDNNVSMYAVFPLELCKLWGINNLLLNLDEQLQSCMKFSCFSGKARHILQCVRSKLKLHVNSETELYKWSVFSFLCTVTERLCFRFLLTKTAISQRDGLSRSFFIHHIFSTICRTISGWSIF